LAKARILAYFMHENEMNEAERKMQVEGRTDSYLIGEVDVADLPTLKQKGLIIQVLKDEEETEREAAAPERLTAVRRHLAFRKPSYVFPRPRSLVRSAVVSFYLVQLTGPLIEDWRSKFNREGVTLLEQVSRNKYTAKLTQTQVGAIRRFGFVKSVQPYQPEGIGPVFSKKVTLPLRPTAPIATRAVAPPAEKVNMVTYEVLTHKGEDVQAVNDWLKNQHVSISGVGERKIRFYLLENSDLLDELALLPQVALIEQYVPPKLHNDVARRLLGIDADTVDPSSSIVSNISETGDGQIVAVADTGIDEHHPDFQGRIAGIVALGRPDDYSDPNGHGTHVTGSVLGDGTASDGQIRGTAPKAKLFFQSLLDESDGLGGLPIDLGELFNEAYLAGARIHNNSWGSATESEYTFNSLEVDEFVAKHRDMLVVISAGNEGQANNRSHSQTGFTDWLSIGSPASSKNALTVGASRSDRTSGGYSQITYGNAWPEEFPDAPIAQEKISGNPEGLAAFSSRGPCTDHRIKPDVVAPGTDIVSTKSSRAPLREFWGPYQGKGGSCYAYMGGTSMAAPLASGCAALVREYYEKSKGHQASAALLKATLINSTRSLKATDAVADYNMLPNFNQGFGCVHMPWAIPNPSEPGLSLEFQDTWNEATSQFNHTGQRFRYTFNFPGTGWLRLCLVWTDVPGRALQNNLDLFLQHTPSGKKWIGNENLPMSLTAPDPENNVEIIRIENALAGEYLIQITASNLLQTPQDYALVVTGKGLTQLQPY
jgi:serine protease AprX